MNEGTGIVTRVSGPLVEATGDALLDAVHLYDTVRVGEMKLLGEVIKIENGVVSAQVYEDTTGLKHGDSVVTEGKPLLVELGPGLMGMILDGIQRPLDAIADHAGIFIKKGIDIPALNREKTWNTELVAKKGQKVTGGDALATVQETQLIMHTIMVPPNVSGTVIEISGGQKKVTDTLAIIETATGEKIECTLRQEWSIRQPRPCAAKITSAEPLITGQRVIDTFFPVTKGGAGCIPGAFGSGKTKTQQQFAKWSDADIIVYIGCGERGNEMTEVLQDFPKLVDPKSGLPLMDRTILIANTSNMPVAAREASIYTGITLAEYYRDMGYHVALMADSTSRWAEALREISGRLEEMPGEEGYPSYLGSRTAAFYERAGMVKTLGSNGVEASLTAVGAVSPPGGDLSEPVTTNTLRVTKVFWGLDASLANKRHYPAINWLTSYSLYSDSVAPYMNRHVHPAFSEWKEKAITLLQKESRLEEIVRLVGTEALSAEEQFILHIAKAIREDYLQQNAFDEIDTYCALPKQGLMLAWLIHMYETGIEKLKTDPEALSDVARDEFFETYPKAKYQTVEHLLAAEYIPDSVKKDFINNE